MKAAFKLENADETEATLSVTMKLGEWKQLQRQLPNVWPSWQFGNEIERMIGAAEKHFFTASED